MEKQIPVYFDSIVVDSPIQELPNVSPNVGRLKVRAFTKYSNRNMSYITDEVADQLIKSATTGMVPVVGFFDQETETWASHTGPTLASAYGYVEDFLGWEPFTDTDGVTREYAVFSVILFTEYFEEAKKIMGQNQSMELDRDSIEGDWGLINDQEYFIYSSAKMLGFCVIGAHEPCFSVSAFFSKNDDTYKNQYEKFSSLLADLKVQVEETIKMTKGGEQPMENFENNPVAVEPEAAEPTPSVEPVVEPVQEPEPAAEPVAEPAAEPVQPEEPAAEPTEFEALQQQFNDLQTSYNELQADYAAMVERVTELESFQTNANTELDTLRAENEQLQASLSTYEAQAVEAENARKNELVEKYEKIISGEEIDHIREQVNDFSYDELESKLAIAFANKQMAGGEVKKVPLPEPEESQFALLMKKYRKN